jgi:hypothetical protein
VLATLPGIPLGLLLLTAAAEPVVKVVLAVVSIAFAAYCLARRTPLALQDDRLAWLFGFAAGVRGGAYGRNGPPPVIDGTLRRLQGRVVALQRRAARHEFGPHPLLPCGHHHQLVPESGVHRSSLPSPGP